MKKIKQIILNSIILWAALLINMWPNNAWAQKSNAPNFFQSYTNPKLAPDFALHDLEGNLVNIRDYRGKVVLLNFWATWCPQCRQEAPLLEKLYNRTKDIIILRINAKESKETILKFLEKNPSKITILLDEKNKVGNLFGVWVHPTSFLMDAEGKIRYRAMGVIDWDSPQVGAVIEKLLEEAKK